ncbi:hypothetical protein ACED29_17260 [Shewanella sp. 5S214]|uniref:hypothetical protein n=1 Tax=Shewanella sp. 5S214 TaxID=3229999 RepID=UPI00352F9808
MQLSENIYQNRPVTIIDILNQNIEILKPESVVIKLNDITKSGDSYFDIGSLCFSIRRYRLNPRSQENYYGGKIADVVIESKEDWRIDLVRSLIEHFRTEVITKSTSTLRNIIKICLNFFEFCEKYSDSNDRTKTFEGFIAIYRDFTDNLKHRIKLAPNNPQSLKRATAASKQRCVRFFLLHHFERSEIDIIRYVPTIKRGRDKCNVVSAPESANRDAFIKFSYALFHELADGIIRQEYAPIKLMLPVRKKLIPHIYLDPSSLSDIILNPDFSWPNFSRNGENSATVDNLINGDRELRRKIRVATNQAKAHRSFITPSVSLSKSYVLAQSAFIACFYASTGINPTVLTHLKVTSETPKSTRGIRFSGLKGRANNKIVYPEFGANFLSTFNKFKKLRSYVVNLFEDEDFWFFHPINSHKQLDSDATLSPLKLFIKAHDFDIPLITPTQIRKGLAVDFLKLSQGNLVITSKKLGNNINTLLSHYTVNSPLEQSREFSDFYQKMFESALERARPRLVNIGVSKSAKQDFHTPAGHCSNTQKKIPLLIEGFSPLAPQPDCSRPETCLFCEHYSIVPDKEDIGKLLGLKELLKLVKLNIGVSDQYISTLAPTFHRIDEIIQYIRDNYPQTESIISDVQCDIEHGIIDSFWDEHYDFLIELSLKV